MVEVIFYKGKDPIARFIRWWTGGRFSHCGIRLWRCLVLDIDLLHGVRARFDPWSPWDVETVQVPYDPLKVLSDVWFGRWTEYSIIEGIRAKLPFFTDNPVKWNCSEMVNDILQLSEMYSCKLPDDIYAKVEKWGLAEH